MAAFTSLSWTQPHSVHVHSLTCKGLRSPTCPQSEQRFVDGNHRSPFTKVLPYHFALYSSWRTNSLHAASLIAFASERFFTGAAFAAHALVRSPASVLAGCPRDPSPGITHKRAKLYAKRHAPAGKPMTFVRLSTRSRGVTTGTQGTTASPTSTDSGAYGQVLLPIV